MCTIDKMLIKGIRSFSPDNTAVVEFYRPLTLIVGHNGAGKTTIIECLKQACTGDLPPNTRSGQSFIHDPKVSGETEVKAQIKLRFQTAAQQPVVIIRSFQLTQKKLKMEYKALDQVLQTFNKETHEKEAITYRCSDMDRLVPSLMGVSKAVLESVIFVHQEESNWPLSEATVLKKKFDDIFAATKYTKALETLKKLRKDKAQEVKEFKLKLEHLNTNKNSAHKLRTEVEQSTRRKNQLEQQISGLEAQIQQQTEEMNAMDAKIAEYEGLQNSIAQQRTRLEVAIKRNGDRQIQLTSAYGAEELETSLMELLQFQEELEPRVAEVVSAIQTLSFELKGSEGRLEGIKKQLGQDLKREAHLSAEAEAHKKSIAERDQALRLAAQEVRSSALPNGALAQSAVQKFMTEFGKHVDEKDAALRQMKQSNQQRDDENSQVIDEVTSQMNEATQKVQAKRRSLQENTNRVQRLQSQVEASAVNTDIAKEAEAAEKLAHSKLQSRQEALDTADFDRELSKLLASNDSVQRKTSSLRQERDRLADTADDGTKLQLLRKEVSGKKSQLSTLVENRRTKLAYLLGCPSDGLPPADKLKPAFSDLVRRHQDRLAKVSSELQQAQGSANTAEGQLEACSADLRRQQQEATALDNRVRDGLAQIENQAQANEGLEPLIEAAQHECTKRHTKRARLQYLKTNVKTYKDHAEHYNECEACGRPFEGTQRETFYRRQDDSIDELPARMAEQNAAINKAETKMRALRALQPDWTRLKTLQSTIIRATEARQRDLEIEIAGKASAAGDLHDQKGAIEADLQEVQHLNTDVVWTIDRLAIEIATGGKEIARIENRMKIAGSARTVGDVDAELEELDSERGNLERRKDELLRRQARLKDEISHLQSSWHSAREELMVTRNALEKRSALEKEITALLAANNNMDTDVAAAAETVEPLKAKREQLTRSRKEKREAAREREAELDGRLRELHNLAAKLGDRCQAVSSYQEAGKAERLKQVSLGLQKLAQQAVEEEARLKELAAEIRSNEDQSLMDNQNKRQIEDLIDYQQSLQEEQRLKKEIDKVSNVMGKVGDMMQIHQRFSELQKTSSELRGKQNMAQGSLGTVLEGLNRAKQDLGDVAYRNIDQKYRKQLVELKTTELAVQDLDKYFKALEKALLIFHTNKMAEINKVVKELWQKTYRNRDIDCIQIKADADGAKSYAYRVVMQAGGAELEMRGRCSAGQKVLACLIIRLALAETFCLKCGILALDEPTTNLDAANSESLAEALRNIMETRRAQSNFQLVVITHDEKFAQLIGKREHAEYMYRITKDENQHSHIEKEEMHNE